MTVTARPRPATKPSLPSTPYKGLTHYSASDALFFFGREEDTEIIVANLMASRLTLLYGESGVGKSSLLRAGVAKHIEELARENVERDRPPRLVAVVFPEDDADERLSSWRDEPVAALAKAIERAVAELRVEVEPPSPDQPLADLLAAWTELLGSDLLLILDQFEEYLLYHEEEGGEGTLARELPPALTRRGLRASFLISIREDALARLDRFKTSIPNLLDNYLRVDHLDREAAEDAIRKPLERWHELGGNAVEPEDALVEAVLKDIPAGKIRLGQAGAGEVAAESEDVIETPFLQLVMERLWAEDGTSGKLTLATYERLGRATEIVRTHLDDKMRDLRESEQRIAAKIFQDLVTPSGQKVAWTANDLAVREKVPKDELEGVLTRLREGRIVRPVAPPPNRPHESRYEIFHDKLADAILAWSTAFNQHEERAAANRRVLRLRGVVLGLVLLVGVAGWFWYQAFEGRKTAHSEEFASNALSLLPVNPNQALKEALRAVDEKRTDAALNALRQSINAAHERVVLHAQQPVDYVAWSSDGSTFGFVSGRHVYVWRGRTIAASVKSPPRILTPPRKLAGNGLWSLSLSPHGRFAAAASSDGVFVWNTQSGKVKRLAIDSTDAKFDPANSHVLAVAGFESYLVDWTTRRRWALPHATDDYIYSMSFAGNGRRLAANGDRVLVWNVGTCINRKTASSCPLVTDQGFSGSFWDVQLSSDGKRLVVTTGEEGRIYAIGKHKRLKQERVLRGDTGFGYYASFGRDDSFVATTGLDGTARIWDWRSGSLVFAFPGHTGDVWDEALDPGGRFLLTGGSEGTARIWSVDTASELVDPRMPTTHSTPVMEGDFAPRGRYVMTLSSDNRSPRSLIRIWKRQGRGWAQGHFVKRLRVSGGSAGFVPRHPGEIYLVPRAWITSYVPRVVRRFRTGLLLWNWSRRKGPTPVLKRNLTGAAFSPDGTHAVVTTDAPGATEAVLLLRFRQIPGTPEIVRLPTKAKAKRNRYSRRYDTVAYSPDGEHVAAAGAHAVWIWDVSRCLEGSASCLPKVLARRGAQTDSIRGIAFSPDGQKIVTAGRSSAQIWWWQAKTRKGRLPLVLRGSGGFVSAAAFSHDGREIATGGADGTTRVWAIHDHASTLLATIHVHGDAITSVAFSPHDSFLLTTSRDGTARIYSCGTCTSSTDKLKEFAKSKLAKHVWVPARSSSKGASR